MKRTITAVLNQCIFFTALISAVLFCIIFFFGDFFPYTNVFGSEILAGLGILCMLSASSLFYRVRILSLGLVVYFLIRKYIVAEQVDSTYVFLLIFLVRKSELQYLHKAVSLLLNFVFFLCKAFPLFSFFIGILLLAFYTYSPLFGSYFEGDEWYWMRVLHSLYASENWAAHLFSSSFNFRDVTNPHVIPLSDAYQLIQFHFFKLNYDLYALASILFHGINAVLVGLFTLLYCRSKKVAVGASFLFVALATHAQAVTWMAATVNTQPALFFGLLSLICMLAFSRNNAPWQYGASLLFLLASLLSKETALIFLVLVPALFITENKRRVASSWQYVGFAMVGLLFVLLQYYLRAASIPDFSSQGQPWLYGLIGKLDSLSISLLAFRFVTFLLKTVAQVFIPISLISELGIFITEFQFPYFWEEQAIGGTKFLVFIHSVAPEFLSYAIGMVIVLLLLAYYRVSAYKTQLKLFLLAAVGGVIPIVLITVRFPWWGFTATIDERHFYHFSFIIAIILALFFDELSRYLEHKIRYSHVAIYSALLLFTILGSASLLQEKIELQQKATTSEVREIIVTTLQSEVPNPSKKMIFYIESNASFYGFAEPMLPFQTSFAHMLPVIFSHHMHPEGLSYPDSFYTQSFLQQSQGSLVSQGVYAEGEYLLGHYSSKTNLLKYLHDNRQDIEHVRGFRFDSGGASFVSITDDLQTDLYTFFEENESFLLWNTWDINNTDMIFKTDPSWEVVLDETTAVVQDRGRTLFEIEAFENPDVQTITDFVAVQKYAGVPIGADYITTPLEMKYDETDRPLYSPKYNTSIFYTYSGNNNFFYKIQFYDATIQSEVLPLLQFSDNMLDLL